MNRETKHRYRLARMVLMCLLPVALTACDEPNTFAPPPPPEVTVEFPIRTNVNIIDEFTGRTEAFDTVEIRARVQGFLESVEFEDGDIVRAGEVLYHIESEPFEAERDSAAAELEQRQAALKLANLTLTRIREVAARQAANQQELDQAESDATSARGAVKAAQARLDIANLNLGYTTITAPIDGRVSRNDVSVGNLVGTGASSVLTTIVRDDRIHVYFAVDERRLIAFLRENPREKQPEHERPEVSLLLADSSRYPINGRIDFAETTMNPDTGTVQVRAVFQNPEGKLFPGMFVRVVFVGDSSEALTIPDVAIQRDQAGSFLLIVNEKNIVERRNIEPGASSNGRRAVLSGISESDRVVVNGLQRARPGRRVTPIDIAHREPSMTGDAG